MPHKAFLVGVNTLDLQYAETDARLMQEALQLYGYEVILASVQPDLLIKQLNELLDRHDKTDTLLFYFSGHGQLLRGKLQLVLGEEPTKQSNIINIQDITGRLENSVANHKLIILDCCHAGAVSDWHSDFAEMFRVLTASGRLEKAKEIIELKASFLTYFLHQALMHRYLEIANRQDHKIYLNELYDWLKHAAQQYNATSSNQVPLPNLLGNQKANFELVTVPTEKFFASEAISEKTKHLEQIRKGIQEQRAQFERVVYRGIIDYLLDLEGLSHLPGEADDILVEVKDFLANHISAQELTDLWKKFSAKKGQTEPFNYPALFKNLQLGNIVVFLNNGIPQETVEQLNDFFKVGPSSSFTEVCELAEISHGKSLLCNRLEEFLHPAPVSMKFYELLAQLSAPIIVISSGYDVVLENLFKERNKKYAMLSHAINAQGAKIVFVEYSDEQPSKEYTTETLSEATLLECGYSIIYKIRGYLKMINHSEREERLVLSEQDYFHFSRKIDGLMPNYLVSLLNRRGFWFVGNPPRSWEERLLIYAILEKRQGTQQKFAFVENLDHFSSIYLKKKGFEHYAVNLVEWGEQLWAQGGR